MWRIQQKTKVLVINILVEALVLTEERLELFDLGMAFGNAVQYPPVFSWCGIVESKEAHTLHMAKEDYLYVFLLVLVPLYLRT